MNIYNNVKNIIFDLGRVLIDLDENKTIEAFGGAQITALYSKNTNNNFVEIAHKFERGEISPSVFRDNVKTIFNLNTTDELFDFAWNAMVGIMTNQRIEIIKQLKNKYRLFVLSNTNEIHYEYFTKLSYWDESLFEATYFSQILGLRKPEKDIFNVVLLKHNLNASETLFIDDNADNINSAKEIGLITHHNTSEVTDFLKQLL